MKIYCCGCEKEVKAILKTGKDIYSGRGAWDLKNFYQCEICNNFVGVHKDTLNPLGVIPKPEFKKIRRQIHDLIDPLWQQKVIKRGRIYGKMKKLMNLERDYHTADLRTEEEHIIALECANKINNAIQFTFDYGHGYEDNVRQNCDLTKFINL